MQLEGKDYIEEEEEEEIDRITVRFKLETKVNKAERSLLSSSQAADAWMFPLVGSVVLTSLWLLFRYGDKDLVNRLFGWYFRVMSLGALSRVRESTCSGAVRRGRF